jgi:hypothetical protein
LNKIDERAPQIKQQQAGRRIALFPPLSYIPQPTPEFGYHDRLSFIKRACCHSVLSYNQRDHKGKKGSMIHAGH